METASVVCAGMLVLFFGFTAQRYSVFFQDRLSFWLSAVRTSPHAQLAHLNLGAMYYLDQEYAQAESEFNRAAELEPNARLIHNNQGLIYMQKRMFPEAEREFDLEINLNPGYASAYYNKGVLYSNLGRKDLAVAFWKKTLDMDKDYIDAMRNLALYYAGTRDATRYNYYAEQLKLRGFRI